MTSVSSFLNWITFEKVILNSLDLTYRQGQYENSNTDERQEHFVKQFPPQNKLVLFQSSYNIKERSCDFWVEP